MWSIKTTLDLDYLACIVFQSFNLLQISELPCKDDPMENFDHC